MLINGSKCISQLCFFGGTYIGDGEHQDRGVVVDGVKCESHLGSGVAMGVRATAVSVHENGEK